MNDLNQSGFLSHSVFRILLFFLIAPIIIIPLLSLIPVQALDQNLISWTGYIEIAKPVRINEILTVTFRGLLVAGMATLISFVLAYFLVLEQRLHFRLAYLILISLPFLVNESVRIFSWQAMLAEYGFANYLLSGLWGEDIRLFNSTNYLNVYIVMIIGLIPFGIFINILGLSEADRNLWSAARDLGANEWAVFWRITIPLGKKGLLFSFVVTFFFALAMSQEVVFLGGDTKQSLRILISDLLSANKLQAVFSIGTIFILIAFFSMKAIQKVGKNNRYFGS